MKAIYDEEMVLARAPADGEPAGSDVLRARRQAGAFGDVTGHRERITALTIGWPPQCLAVRRYRSRT